MRVAQSWGLPGALAGGLRGVGKLVWFGEVVQLISALDRETETHWVLVRGLCSLGGWPGANWVMLLGFCAIRGWAEAI